MCTHTHSHTQNGKGALPFNGFEEVVRARGSDELTVEMVGSLKRDIKAKHEPQVLTTFFVGVL